MRLIDADKLKYYGNHIGDEYEDRFHDFQYVDRDQIDKAPSIDIVRCQECKYGEYREEFDDYECHASGCGLVYDADFFCADGERRES